MNQEPTHSSADDFSTRPSGGQEINSQGNPDLLTGEKAKLTELLARIEFEIEKIREFLRKHDVSEYMPSTLRADDPIKYATLKPELDSLKRFEELKDKVIRRLKNITPSN